LDGKSFAPQLTTQTASARQWVFSQLGRKKMARDGRLMLHQDGSIFDIGNDPFEKKNLASSNDPDVSAAKARLENVLKTLQ
jgi:hypothetical protein